MPAESTGVPEMADVLAQLPYLTVHLVDLPERLWVADPGTATCWLHKGGTAEQRMQWAEEAATAILARRDGAIARPGPRLRSVGR